MQAVVYTCNGDPDVLELVDREVPEPGPGEVRVRVAVSAVNPTDWKARRGNPVPAGFQILAPALADDRCYRVGAALEAALLEQWGGPLLDKAPALNGESA